VYSHAADIARLDGRLSEAVDYQRRANDAEKILYPPKAAAPGPSGVELIKAEDPNVPPIASPDSEPDAATQPAPK
jgi:hypothetical protein